MDLEKQLQDKIEKLEMKFILEDFETEKPYVIKEGSLPILIAAPHSVTQVRNGVKKPGQFRTGVLAEWLHQKTDCFCAYKTKDLGDDANDDFDNPFKYDLIRTVKQHNIALVISLHIMSPERNHMVDIGTKGGENLVHNKDIGQQIMGIYNRNGVEGVEIDNLFGAKGVYRLTTHVARTCRIDAIQIAHNWRIMDTRYSAKDFINVFKSLEEIIDCFGGSKRD